MAFPGGVTWHSQVVPHGVPVAPHGVPGWRHMDLLVSPHGFTWCRHVALPGVSTWLYPSSPHGFTRCHHMALPVSAHGFT